VIAVVYLVWGPLGPGPLRDFLASYDRHPAGTDHELVIVFNGVRDEQRATLEAELQGTRHRLLELPRLALDLAAYGHAAQSLEHPRVCFLNSYSVILADGWLGHLLRAAELPRVGLVGATGSWESRVHFIREGGGLEHWIYQLVKLPQRRREYDSFPNPHVRTSAFMLERALALELGLDRVRDKSDAYRLESGRQGITREIQRRGLRAVVVDRNGLAYDAQDWARAGTYRSAEQRNLLVADNRTNDWQRGSRAQRRRMSRRTWGRAHAAE